MSAPGLCRFRRKAGVGALLEAAETAAGRELSRQGQLLRRSPCTGHQVPHRGPHLRQFRSRTGVVERGGRRRDRHSLRDALFLQDSPKRDGPDFGQFLPENLQAARAGGDHQRRAHGAPLVKQLFPCRLQFLPAAGPSCRSSAAPEPEPHSAVKNIPEMSVDGFRCPGRDPRKAAPRKKEKGAPAAAGLMAQKRRPLRVGKGHVLKGELVGRGRHLLLEHHLLPGRTTQVPHGKTAGADPFALAAQGTGVDHAVGEPCSLDDREIIVDLTGELFRVSFVVLQEGTGLHAFHALAEQAPPGLPDSLVSGVSPGRNRHGRSGVDSFDIREKPGLIGPLLLPGGGEGRPLEKPFHRLHPPAAGGGPENEGRGVPSREDTGHGRLEADGILPSQELREGTAQGIVQAGIDGIKPGGQPFGGDGSIPGKEVNAEVLHPLELLLHHFPGEERGEGEKLTSAVLPTEDGDGIAFPRAVKGRREGADAAAQDRRCASRLRNQDPGPAERSFIGAEPLQRPKFQGAALLPAETGIPAGGVADPGENPGEGKGFLDDLPPLVEPPLRRSLAEGPAVEVEGTGCPAPGRLFLDTLAFEFHEG